MQKRILVISLLLNVLLAACLIAGFVSARAALHSMEASFANAEVSQNSRWRTILASDRDDKINYASSLMNQAIADAENGRPSVRAPKWTR